ncbi:MAG: adenylate/guanylate cyclase domain-containing protein [Alphaproteobacteria bacterium]|nr:adenylate/guanylate cyclase domain-containing protein [Alphaproteobacteria bacterium]
MHNVAFLTQAKRVVEDVRTATMLPAEPQDKNVIILAINEGTLSLFPYRSPVDRGFLANLLTSLERLQPRVVGLDILFDQPTESAKDQRLKDAIAKSDVPLVVAYTNNPRIVDPTQRAYLERFVPAPLRAHVELMVDPVDGVVRWIYPGAPTPDGGYVPGFARAIAARAGVTTPRAAEEIVWHGRPDAATPPFRIFPAQTLALLPPAWFKDKIVLIGEIVTLTDRARTPFTIVYPRSMGSMAGVEILANEVSQLINHRHIGRLSWPGEVLFVGLFAALGTAFGAYNHRMAFYLAGGAAVLAVLWIGSFALFHFSGLMTPLVEPSAAFLLATWTTTATTGREAKRQRVFIQSAFSRYVNPQLVRQLANDPASLRLGGEMRNMTLMFGDIRNFTSIAESMEAQELTQFINRFMTPMTTAILNCGGTIDKYMGDGIMAFWNAPVENPAHAEDACRAALSMRAALAQMNENRRAEAAAEGRNFERLRIGIGLNTGLCCVGNMGSDHRFDYSVIGDNVNLCSRLEGQTKTYGVDIILGEVTAAGAPGLAGLEIDLIRVKGRTRPLRIFALIGDETVARNPAFIALKADHDAMLIAYRARNWREARTRWIACQAVAPQLMQDFYALYETRITGFEAEPPPQDWDGVYVAMTK